MPNNLGNVASSDIINVPQPTKEKRQRSMSLSDAYFTRFIPQWSQPTALTPNQWRSWAANQPIAATCKETMISYIADLDWKITPRKSDQRDELRATIEYYEKFFRRGGNSGLDWVGVLEWFLSDLLDLPFGTGWEIGRKGDEAGGRVAWIEPMDGGTLFPTNNKDFPVVQYYNGFSVTFPDHAVARAYLSPRTEFERKGWGMAPPERAFLAMEMLARGDRYYANLLLDIPPVGVFDLGDITWDDANTWAESFRTFTQGGSVNGFKIPVLAEHTGKVEFIPLGKPPTDIMYDRITLKYAALVTSAFGMSLSDIGLQGSSASGETLAGAIRGEQKTNRTGKARNKSKIKYWAETILPANLQFDFIDMDGEGLSMMGRARLANATAMNAFHQMGAISPTEARLQAIQDGLFTISMPEEPPPDAQPPMPAIAGGTGKKKVPERPASVGSPQPPSLGGDGEVKKMRLEKGRAFPARIGKLVKRICEDIAPILAESAQSVSEDDLYLLRSAVDESLYGEEDVFGIGEILKAIWVKDDWVNIKDDGLEGELRSIFSESDIPIEDINLLTQGLKQRVSEGIKTFIGRAVVSTLKDVILQENALDVPIQDNYAYIVETMRKSIVENFSDYASACINVEAQKLIEETMRKNEQNSSN